MPISESIPIPRLQSWLYLLATWLRASCESTTTSWFEVNIHDML